MSQKISLKEVERQTFRSTFQDGLVDIFLGVYLSMFAIGPYLSPYLGDFWSSFVFLPIWALVFAILWWVRRHVVKPRLGAMQYGSWRKARMIRFNALIFAVLTVSLILGVLSAVQFGSIPGWMHMARLSLIFLVSFSLAAYFLDLTRLYLYGLAIAAAPFLGELLYVKLHIPHHGLPVTFGLASAGITLNGLVLLVRLLRHLPPEAAGETAGETTE